MIWEYTNVILNNSETSSIVLNEMGAQGWEAYHVEEWNEGKHKYYLKRSIVFSPNPRDILYGGGGEGGMTVKPKMPELV